MPKATCQRAAPGVQCAGIPPAGLSRCARPRSLVSALEVRGPAGQSFRGTHHQGGQLLGILVVFLSFPYKGPLFSQTHLLPSGWLIITLQARGRTRKEDQKGKTGGGVEPPRTESGRMKAEMVDYSETRKTRELLSNHDRREREREREREMLAYRAQLGRVRWGWFVR